MSIDTFVANAPPSEIPCGAGLPSVSADSLRSALLRSPNSAPTLAADTANRHVAPRPIRHQLSAGGHVIQPCAQRSVTDSTSTYPASHSAGLTPHGLRRSGQPRQRVPALDRPFPRLLTDPRLRRAEPRRAVDLGCSCPVTRDRVASSARGPKRFWRNRVHDNPSTGAWQTRLNDIGGCVLDRITHTVCLVAAISSRAPHRQDLGSSVSQRGSDSIGPTGHPRQTPSWRGSFDATWRMI